MRRLVTMFFATAGLLAASDCSADVSIGGSASMGGSSYVDPSLTNPPAPTYDYPTGPNIYAVYQNASNGSFLIKSSEGTLLREITRSDVSTLSRSLSELDADGLDNDGSYVAYTGYWINIDDLPSPCAELAVCGGETATNFSIDRDGSIRLLEVPNLSQDDAGFHAIAGPIEVCLTNCDTDVDRISYFYGRETVLDPLTSSLKSQKLIAYSQEAYDYAISEGYEVLLKDPNIRKIGSFSATEGWAVTADEVRGSQGNILLSSSDGMVSVAEGSLRIQPTTSPSLPGTTISSSDGTLFLGDSDTHRTIVRGTLEVPDPTAPSHAANKRYVDGATSLAMAMSSLPVSPNGGPYLGISAGTLGGETAFALGFSNSEPDTGFQFHLNLGHSEISGTGAAVGFGIGF